MKKTKTNKYFVSVLVETSDAIPAKPVVTELTALGIDVGIKHFATFSDSRKIENPKCLRNKTKRLACLQRRTSKKQKGSVNRYKASFRVAKLHEKINNQRQDFLHKITYQLTHENQVNSLVIEDLNVSGMMKNHRLARSIADVSWGKFRELLTYKTEWYGKNLLLIGRFDPSSKLCSVCGNIKQDLTLDDRVWTCSNCNTQHDRDINAAQNIKKLGLHKHNFVYSGQVLSEEPVELSALVGAMKQEA